MIERITNRANMAVGWTPSTAVDKNFDGDNLWANISDLGPRVLMDTAKRVSDEAALSAGATRAPVGSLFFSFKLSVGSVSFAGVPMFTNEAIAAFWPKQDLDIRFAYYAFPLFILMNAGENIYGAPILNQTRLSQTRVAFPPTSEQSAIANYLDRETAQIDAFIAKNDELISLLTERRRATVLNAVTKGIEEKAARHDSGAEWLGAVPVHWSVLPLKASVRSSKNGTWGEDPDGGANDVRCVRVADFDRPQQRIHDKNYTKRKVRTTDRLGRELRSGNLLLEKSGGGEKSPVGFVVLYDGNEPAVCSNFIARLDLAEGMDPHFWTYVHGAMYASRLTERSLKQSTGIQNLDQGQYFSERVAIPPFEEQQCIADHLDVRTGRIDRAIATAGGANALALERRAALISAAVTGQIDMREQL